MTPEPPDSTIRENEDVVEIIEPIPAFLDSTSPNRRYRPRSISHLPYKRNSERRLQKVRDAQKFRSTLNRTASTESLINHDAKNDDQNNNDVSTNHHVVNGDANKTITSIVSMTSTISQSVRRMYHQKSLGYEGLDYDICENMLHLEEENNARRKGLGNHYLEFTRWLVIFFIGALTGLTACCILFIVEILTDYKYQKLMYLLNSSNPTSMIKPYITWLLTNGIPVFLGSWMVTYMAPVAAGSGIPVIKCYLNGVKVPEVVRVKTYFAKMIGVICSVVGGLACGKEGPMIHCGATIAAGISQAKSTTFNLNFEIGLSRFREDHEKRDFVSAGAAAGVAAAFGSPLGGVLFALEEGASFWNQQLVLRIFFCSLVSSFTLNSVVSVLNGERMGSPGLLNFGKFQDIDYSFYEIPLYAAMGVFGGITGALFNLFNMKLTILRQRWLDNRPMLRIAEAVIVSLLTASIGFALMNVWSECTPKTTEETHFPVTYGCPKGQHNVMAALWFNTPEATLKNLFHNKDGTWNVRTLTIFVITYFFISCVTYGLSISSGLFIPGLMLGATWGRLVGIGLSYIMPNETWIHSGKFALIGASASLGGIVRMTISLTVILIETTGNLSFGLPIMITVFTAKWVGDYFNEGIYDIHIGLSNVPFLGWQPPPDSSRIFASEVMHSPVTSLQVREKVRNIVNILSSTHYNGFPVVDENTIHQAVRTFGRYRGLILRSQLLVMLKARIFQEYSLDAAWKDLNSLFRNSYPRYPNLEQIMNELSTNELEMTMDLRPVMNPSAYTISHAASLNRIFRLFRALGLRHIVVLNDYNEVIGIVTRKDLAFYCTVRFAQH
ncbi:H(+)/Cl(-) exchange transporter 7-like protein [Euroglyphus maynei]|uniref:Chloride channel protein n=1 Tax=Euroglyphus maynei TaxID=6958 RepID=A0A1Y3B4G8_EURMA|nr:H(+)/Cl(-) exchange transporter 7-like protein [Euroglyphus maynei]